MQYIDLQIKAPVETIHKSLVGNWRAEYLFLLAENYKLYDFIQQQVSRCDQKIEQYLQKQAAISNEGVLEDVPVDSSVKKRINKDMNHPPLM